MLSEMIFNVSNSLNHDQPALDPIVVNVVGWNNVSTIAFQVAEEIEMRMGKIGVKQYTMLCMYNVEARGWFEIPIFAKDVPDKYCPANSVYILVTEVNGNPTIYPYKEMSWSEYFLECIRGNNPGILITKPFLQGKITVSIELK